MAIWNKEFKFYKSYLKHLLVIVPLLCVLLLSCHGERQSPLNELEELTEDIRLHYKEYTTSDWKEAYARYEQIAADMENYQYTTDEIKKIGELEGECVGYFMKSAFYSLDGIESEINGFLDGLNKTIEN
jgi:hypothetical protein